MDSSLEKTSATDAPATIVDYSSTGLVRLIQLAQSPEQPQGMSPDVCSSMASRFLKLGEPLMAFDVLSQALAKWPTHVRLRQLQGLSLLRTGAGDAAAEILETLYREGYRDEETVGLLARTFKTRAEIAANPDERTEHLKRAAAMYLEAFRLTRGYWTGINAATLSILIGQFDAGRALADEVRLQLDTLFGPDGSPPEDYWALATRGEVMLILGDLASSVAWYARAARVAGRQFADLAATRRNARSLITGLKIDGAEIERVLAIPKVVVFTASPCSSEARNGADIRRDIHQQLGQERISFGYSSAAPGGEIAFLEELQDAGVETVVVLPMAVEHFAQEHAKTPGWHPRFEQICASATRVVVASERRIPGCNTSDEFASLLLLGLAKIRAGQLDTELSTLTLPPGQDERSAPESVAIKTAENAEPVIDPKQTGFTPCIRALLFADVVGFSKLGEDDVARFTFDFLGEVGKLTDASPHRPVSMSTWGDAFYFVFDTVRDAGLFALELMQLMSATSWLTHKFRSKLSLRIGLHAGAVYAFNHPITHRQEYTGTHVSRAARIEPVTPPGHVYASEAFAALAAAEGVREFSCDYVGQVPLAKSYGTFPMYHLRGHHSAKVI